jgi:hypothetical protein
LAWIVGSRKGIGFVEYKCSILAYFGLKYLSLFLLGGIGKIHSIHSMEFLLVNEILVDLDDTYHCAIDWIGSNVLDISSAPKKNQEIITIHGIMSSYISFNNHYMEDS